MLLVLFKKFIGKSQSHNHAQESGTPEYKVALIQRGDLKLRNQFITDYQPYIAKIASRFCKRYIEPARDDEFSIAISAFNEAISQFSAELGRSFLAFAETVVRRRLIDYIRSKLRHTNQVPYSSFDVEDEENNIMNPIEIHQSIELFEKEQLIEERKSEIIDFNRCLSDFGISISELVDISPKHADSREILFGIGNTLATDSSLMRDLVTKRTLPIKELLIKVDVSRKTLERNRKFIIAIALIHHGPYRYLREYLHIPQVGERKVDNE